MKLQEIAILLPCHSLEDFPSYGDAATADGLFAGWTALWHPALLANCGRKPSWYRADNPPSECDGRLFVVPRASEERLTPGWVERARDAGATVIVGKLTRPAIVEEALAQLDPGETRVDAETAADFHALGFAFLMVELLTRQMRYMSNLDQIHFENQSVAAARAALSGDAETLNKHLTRCFDVLQEARERFYPVDSYLIDLTLVAETTLKESLRRELERGELTNYLICGETLEKLVQVAPENAERLREAMSRGKASIVGGEWREAELPLWPVNDLLDNFARGGEAYVRYLGRRPAVFGRRRAGLSPLLPQLLSRHGFRGALHVTLDDGLFPKSEQSRIRWEGVDRSVIDCLARAPVDVSRPETFLGLCRTMGESMDRDHVATMLFAHWPAQTCVWYEDLRRAARRCDCLGKFITLEDYFTQTSGSGRLVRFEPEKYRVPYLHESIARQDAHPVSAFIDHFEHDAAKYPLETLCAINRAVGCAATTPKEGNSLAAADNTRLGNQARREATNLVEYLARGGSDSRQGVFIFNPLSAVRSGVVAWPLAWGMAVTEPATPQQHDGAQNLAYVTVPAMGYVWLPLAPAPAATQKTAPPSMVEGHTLRNEYLEAVIGDDTGALKALRDFRVRGTLLSQQLARRWPGERPSTGDPWRDPDETAVYSVMAADEIEVLSHGPVSARVRTRGRLMHPEGRVAARFELTYRLDRGSRVLVIDATLEPVDLPAGNPWECYFANRFAWGDAAADVLRSAAGGCFPTEAKQVEAAQFVEVQGVKRKLTIFTGGAPYQRRTAMRMLDSILIPQGELRRQFMQAVGVEVPYPYHEAWAQGTGLVVADTPTRCPATGATSWLAHVDAKNLMAMRWSTVEEDGQVIGLRVRLLETAGRAGNATLRCFRNLVSARQSNYLGETLTELSPAGDAATIDFSGHEWLELELVWRRKEDKKKRRKEVAD